MASMSKAAQFVEANKHSLVVLAEIKKHGTIYLLDTGAIFMLTREECIEAEKLAGGPPRWKTSTEENTCA